MISLGLFTVDKDDNIISINKQTIDYARCDNDILRWHGKGVLEINDLVIYIGGIDSLIMSGIKNANLKDYFNDNDIDDTLNRYVVIWLYKSNACYPFLKKMVTTNNDKEDSLVDIYYYERHIVISSVHDGYYYILLNDQKILAHYNKGFLLISGNEKIKYFSDKDETESEIVRILRKEEFSECCCEALPLGLKYFFGEEIFQVIKNVDRNSDIAFTRCNNRIVAIKRVDYNENNTELNDHKFLIGDEKAISDTADKFFHIYDSLYNKRLIQTGSDSLDCEARLKGTDEAIIKINKQLDKVCHKTVTIVLTGESGTGKTFLALKIHKNSKRAENPFIHVNCAAISHNLIESELFGYEEGSFTGAKRGGKIGYFEMAQGGTLFLDEISELSTDLQGKLLEVLQEGTFYRVGGTSKISADVRLIVATNQNLKQLVHEGRFRKDLYYRINVFPIHLPPLRERLNMLYGIIEDTLPDICAKLEIEPLTLTKKALAKLEKYSWPGNIRELENVLEKASVMTDDRYIRQSDIVLDDIECMEKFPRTLKEQLEMTEKEILFKTCKKYRGNRKKMAESLGLSKTTLFNKLQKYGIDVCYVKGTYDEFYR